MLESEKRPVATPLGRRLFAPSHKKLKQIIEKPPPQRRRRDTLVVALDEAAALGLRQLAQDRGERQPGALLEEPRRKTVVEPQRVHHELEAQGLRRDVVPLLE